MTPTYEEFKKTLVTPPITEAEEKEIWERYLSLHQNKPQGEDTQKATCRICKHYPEDGYCKIKKTGITADKTACNKYINIKYKDEPEEKEQVPQHIIDAANEILDKQDPFKYIFDVLQKLHVGDQLICKTLIITVGAQSADNTKGIQPKVDGGSGKGKSDVEKKMAHLIPKKYLLTGSMSDKVLYYKKILPGTWIYSDDVDFSDDLVGTIKRATSNFQRYTPHHTLDKDRTVLENEIPPRVVWALNSVDNNQSLQLLNRQFGGSVDESPEQDARVLEFQKMSAMLGEPELSESDEVLICRQIIRDIKEHLFTVYIPYSYLIEWEDAGNRRNFDMFQDMIRAFAVFRYRQRERHEKLLFANLQDFDDAVELYTGRSEQQGRKLTDTELKILKAIHSCGDECDSKRLQEITGLSQGRIAQIMTGKKNSDSGLLSKVKELHAEKRFIREVTEKGGYTTNKMYYTLKNFNAEAYNKPVVWMDKTAREELLPLLPTITRLLILKTTSSISTITTIILNNNIHSIHSNSRYQNFLNSYIYENSKTGNSGNSDSADSGNEK